jgi:hypothetical protein
MNNKERVYPFCLLSITPNEKGTCLLFIPHGFMFGSESGIFLNS